MAKPWSSMAVLSMGLATMSLMMFYVTTAQPYDGQVGGVESASDYDYAEDNFRDLLQLPHTQKRAPILHWTPRRITLADTIIRNGRGRLCIRRGRSCSSKVNLCCNDWECRCNLFGSNCKCARPGFFGMGK